ncbi:hypothetical protein ACWGJP_01985 [Microbacterium sp. NPDC055903]
MDDERDGSEGFAAEFRAAVAGSGMSLGALHRRLADRGSPVSMATLSYWRSGARQPDGAPSLAAVEAIEDVLGLERGHLLARIRPAARVGRVPEPKPVFAAPDIDLEIAETAEALGTVAQAALRDLSVSITADIDAHGDLSHQSTRALIQATEGTLAEVPLYDLAIPGTDETKTITRITGARVDRSMRHPAGRIVCDVLVLDDPVAAGATGLIEYTELIPVEYPERRTVWHAVDRPNRQILIWAHFAEGAEPDWCEEYTEVDGEETVRMLPAGRASVHTARFGFGPGVLGIRWGYDGDE